VVDWPNLSQKVFLSSIMSTELQKIVFSPSYMSDSFIFARRMKEWFFIDEELCVLVDRLRTTGYRHTLEAELRLKKIKDDPGRWDFTKFLPEFRGKGIVTVVDAAHGDRLLHSSTHGR